MSLSPHLRAFLCKSVTLFTRLPMIDSNILAGPALRRLRKRESLTQAAMAGMLGISPSYLNLIERNQRPLSARVLPKPPVGTSPCTGGRATGSQPSETAMPINPDALKTRDATTAILLRLLSIVRYNGYYEKSKTCRSIRKNIRRVACSRPRWQCKGRGCSMALPVFMRRTIRRSRLGFAQREKRFMRTRQSKARS